MPKRRKKPSASRQRQVAEANQKVLKGIERGDNAQIILNVSTEYLAITEEDRKEFIQTIIEENKKKDKDPLNPYSHRELTNITSRHDIEDLLGYPGTALYPDIEMEYRAQPSNLEKLLELWKRLQDFIETKGYPLSPKELSK